MKLYSRKHFCNVERQTHFGVGKSTHTACGKVLFSRLIPVSIHSDSDGALITDDIKRVTCKRCLATTEIRLRRFLAIEARCPGIFDHATLCGEKWLLDHALDRSRKEIDGQKLEVTNGQKRVTLLNTMPSKGRKYILKALGEAK